MLGYGVLKKIFNFKILIFIWLLFIPTQLGWHFWPEWSHVMGLRVDYLSPTLYFLDILWILLIISNFQKTISKQIPISKKQITIKNILILLFVISNFQKTISKQIPISKKQFPNIKIILIFAFVLINIFVAENQWVAGIKWLRIFQWIITFKLILNNKKLFKEMLFKVIPIWIVGESLLGLAQVINGGSLNGIFYWLGERRFSYISLGVAQISYMGQGLIRAYGTFSHPNSLAGFLLISLIIWMRNQNLKFKISNLETKRIIYWIVVFCGLLGLFLSGSRTIWAIGITLLIFNFQFSIFNWKQKMGTLLIAGGLVILIFSLISNSYRISDFVGGWDSEGMAKRGGLMIASIKMIKDHPLFGVGAGNFLVQLPIYQKNSGVFWLQPVHNIIALIIAEFGFLGFILAMKFSIFNFQFSIKKKNSLILWGIILVTGMVDHYWLTLPQNWWLLCMVIGII